jgi:hypothetical protein
MFTGNFQTIDLAEVGRLLCASAQSGVLRIRQGDREASLSLQLGQMIDAHCGDFEGLDALALIASTFDGEFAFDAGAEPKGQSLAAYPTQQIIESLQQEIAEQRSLAAALPSADALLRYVPGGAQSGLHATTDDLSLLLLADGRRTVSGIASAARRDLAPVQAALARFLMAGVIEEIAAGAGEQESDPPPPGDAPRFWRGKRVA